ncbi:SUMF1/EgtB/PvdO family nonheme iron enzyme [Candidatus Chloroploca sp. Khr17]|uniref:formylglycine-generating enzyme family protein n=1 Tax=Candidatus Chloroploca sp. Khr17 TaxID=2496869 RepID=UPI0013ECB8BA|nr:SUMF1/EgtB/PvdO family nonheme iron enzyme [Candidatus Chloroploca sp. Khr17]
MPSDHDIDRLRQRIAAHRRTLATYLEQVAITGKAHVRPEVPAGIVTARDEIRKLKQTLRRWGVTVEDHPDDDDALGPLPSQSLVDAPVAPDPGKPDASGLPPALDPVTRRRLMNAARAAAVAGAWDEAAAHFAQIAALVPTDQEVQARLTEARQRHALPQRYAALAALRGDDAWEAVQDELDAMRALAPDYADPEGHAAWVAARAQAEHHYQAALTALEQQAWPAALAALRALGDDAASYPDVERLRGVAQQGGAQQVQACYRRGAFSEALDYLAEGHLTDAASIAVGAQIIETPAAPFAVRRRAAEIVGTLGDPRIPVTLAAWQAELAQRSTAFGQPQGYWCYVPAGSYQIGGWDKGQAAATLPLPTFWIARYPITVAQYAPFVAEGYGEVAERWWTPKGWQWKQSSKKTEPYNWNNALFTGANQPVSGVSWYEATAFCAWLSERLAEVLPAGWTLRLPTEAVWEVAAAYDAQGQRRPYPWGDVAPTPDLAISNASGLDRPASVGCCPAGAAACGALDMAGNVGEWACSSYSGYPGEAAQEVKDFIPNNRDVPYRGGLFLQNNTYVRCGARTRSRPYIWNDLQGFRVVAAPPC